MVLLLVLGGGVEGFGVGDVGVTGARSCFLHALSTGLIFTVCQIRNYQCLFRTPQKKKRKAAAKAAPSSITLEWSCRRENGRVNAIELF